MECPGLLEAPGSAAVSKEVSMPMQTKKQNIELVRQAVGWAYSQLNWLTDEEATQAMEDREQLLSALSGKVEESFGQNKLHQGALSPGCVNCGSGTWSCLFINSLCTADCFFCPQDRRMTEERPPATLSDIVFHSPEDYADFVRKVGFKGVSFSGGESLLAYETLISFIREIRRKLGNDIYLWAYSNGDLVDKDKLQGLKQAGLDEIRFNIAGRGYALRSVELALDYIDTVTVEIPAIPEDFEVVKDAIGAMERIGVHHLNLHQLLASPYNYSALAHRNYTFLHQLVGDAYSPCANWVPVLDSEMTALRLILYAVDNGISLHINYCCQAYKSRLQGRGHRMTAAALAQNAFDVATDSGYLRRLTIQGTPATLERLGGVFAATGLPGSLWALNEDRSDLSIHPSLLEHVNVDDCNFTLSYFLPYLRDVNYSLPPQNPRTNSGLVTTSYFKTGLCDDTSPEETTQELVLNPRRTLLMAKWPTAEYGGLSPVTIRGFQKLFIEKMSQREVLRWFSENYDITTKESIQDMARDKAVLLDLAAWERVPSGLPDIY